MCDNNVMCDSRLSENKKHINIRFLWSRGLDGSEISVIDIRQVTILKKTRGNNIIEFLTIEVKIKV